MADQYGRAPGPAAGSTSGSAPGSPAGSAGTPTPPGAGQVADRAGDTGNAAVRTPGVRNGTDAATAAAAEAAAAEAAAAVAELRAEVARLDDAWRRALADLDNLRKRTAREIEQRRAEERARVAAEWLPVIDNLDLALQHAGDADGALTEGVRAVRDQAIAVLARLGFPRRDDLGAKFDPARHEAVATVADPGAPAGTVVRVVRPGYGDGEHQLRPAAVVVAAPPTPPTGSD